VLPGALRHPSKMISLGLQASPARRFWLYSKRPTRNFFLSLMVMRVIEGRRSLAMCWAVFLQKFSPALIAFLTSCALRSDAPRGAVARSARRDPRGHARGARRLAPRWRCRARNACRRRFRRETLGRTPMGRLLRRPSQSPERIFATRRIGRLFCVRALLVFVASQLGLY
jgi:hypothetical protein